MKKYLFLAATALMFAACSNEELTSPDTSQTSADNEAVSFEVYVPQATTRSGRTNVMNTTTLQKTGFGILAYQTDNTGYAAGTVAPNYMWNQQVFFNTAAAGWYYAPLKYWPNETKNDSQTTPTSPAGMPNQPGTDIDRLSFFAYAPWVYAADGTTGVTSPINTDVEAPAAVGITQLSNTSSVNSDWATAPADPMISYTVATDPNQSVDLLWGVAPAGGLTYTSVASGVTESGTNPTLSNGIISIKEGMPLVNLVKPAVNTNLKFMFQHALSRLGVKVVAAVDQVAAGGTFDYGNSKITIEKIEIKGNFGTQGILNLKNTTANVSLWAYKNVADDSNAQNPPLVIAKGTGLAPHLVYDSTKNPDSGTKTQQDVTGVTTSLADALKVSSTYDSNYPEEYGKVETKPAYSPTTPYFSAANAATTKENVTKANYASTYYEAYQYNAPTDKTYLHKYVTNSGVSYTAFTPCTQYPNATVWENIYTVPTAKIEKIDNESEKVTYKASTAYRKVGNTYTQTGRAPEVDDYVFTDEPAAADVPASTSTDYYLAKPNYFMIIPNQAMETDNAALRTLKVKIVYYVSTTDPNVADQVVYTKNVVEKDIVLPHLKNGIAYNLKLILGLTSVKVEAEVADWVTTEGVVNLPQNTSE